MYDNPKTFKVVVPNNATITVVFSLILNCSLNIKINNTTNNHIETTIAVHTANHFLSVVSDTVELPLIE